MPSSDKLNYTTELARETVCSRGVNGENSKNAVDKNQCKAKEAGQRCRQAKDVGKKKMERNQTAITFCSVPMTVPSRTNTVKKLPLVITTSKENKHAPEYKSFSGMTGIPFFLTLRSRYSFSFT